MLRSNAPSHIPKPKSDGKVRARSLARSSTKDVVNSSSKNRPGSIDRQSGKPTLKRSSSFANFRGSNVLGTTGRSSSIQKLPTTPTLGGPGLKRSNSNLTTPCSSRSRSRSPFKLTSDRTTNKKWIFEQYTKVCHFLDEHPKCPDHLSTMIKPPTITTFIKVMDLLLKEIDPKIELNQANYKVVILETLKTLHYPGNISNSLMKTVNTMHAWPQVICIFAWLVDLINLIRKLTTPSSSITDDPKRQKAECVLNFIYQRYFLYNSNNGQEKPEAVEAINTEFMESFATLLNIDEEEIKQLQKEVDKLSDFKEQQLKQISEQNTKNADLKNDIDKLKNEITTFYENKESRQELLTCEIDMLKNRRERLLEAIKMKKENITKLTETIKTQPCDLKEKKRILKRIEQMKHVIDLKREKFKEQKRLKDELEEKLAEAEKKLQTEIYRLNGSLMKLVLFESELKIMHLDNDNFASGEFAEDIKNLVGNIKKFKDRFTNDITRSRSLLAKTKKENSDIEIEIQTLNEKLQKMKEAEESFVREIEKLNKEIELMNKRRKEQNAEFVLNMKKLEESVPDLENAKQRLKEITRMKIMKETQLEEKSEKSLEFFETLRNIVMGNLVEMNNIRTDIFEFLVECLQKINNTQNEIAADLHEMDEIQEK